jgi:hypothetical protein
MARWFSRLRLWRAASDVDTAFGWRERLIDWGIVGLVIKTLSGVGSGAVALVIGIATGYDWPVVVLVAFVVLIGGVFLADRLLNVSTQRKLRLLVTQATSIVNATGTPACAAHSSDAERATADSYP